MGGRGKSLSVSAQKTNNRAYINSLFEELQTANIKFSRANTKFITRDQEGKITWLEKGNTLVGLTHIQQNHASQFEKALGIKRADIASHIKVVIEKGVIVESIPDQGGTKRTYCYKGNYYTVVVTGSNGFIATAFPSRIKIKRH